MVHAQRLTKENKKKLVNPLRGTVFQQLTQPLPQKFWKNGWLSYFMGGMFLPGVYVAAFFIWRIFAATDLY